MAITTVAPIPPEMSQRLINGALNLRGVAAAMRSLEENLDDDQIDAIVVVHMLAKVVEDEADTLSDAHDALAPKAVA